MTARASDTSNTSGNPMSLDIPGASDISGASSTPRTSGNPGTLSNDGRPSLHDQDARATIREELDKTLFVDAGAGSGKTTALVERVLGLVGAGVDMEHIAAVTFTEKAAAELRDRIRLSLERVASPTAESRGDATSSPTTLVNPQQAAAALRQIDGAAVGTLHSFAQRILAEHPTEAGLPPRVEVVDEIGSQIEFEERWRDFVQNLLNNPDAGVSLLVLELSKAGLRKLRGLATKLNENWDLAEEHIDLSVAPPDLSVVNTSDVDAALKSALAHLTNCTNSDDGLARKLNDLARHGRGLTSPDSLNQLTAMAAIRDTAGNPIPRGTSSTANWQNKITEVRSSVKEVQAACEEALGPVTKAALDHIVAILATETLAAAEQRRAAGCLEFQDLLVRARRLLRDPDQGPGVRVALRDRYRRLLLDESQDTDPIQVELAALIACGDDQIGNTPWHELTPDPGRLFFVGDAKQSIYRFRRADIATYLKAGRYVEQQPHGQVLELFTNFRSTAPVIRWVNQAFEHLISAENDSQPTYVRLASVRRGAPQGPSVALLGAEPVPDGSDGSRVNAEQLRKIEATTVARAIASALDEGWHVNDDNHCDGHGWRPAKPGDIAVLLPSRISLEALEDALDEAGISYRAETSTLVYDTREVRDLLLAAHAVSDPTDELAVVAALRSSLYGCGDDDLAHWKLGCGGRFSLLARPPSDGSRDGSTADSSHDSGDSTDADSDGSSDASTADSSHDSGDSTDVNSDGSSDARTADSSHDSGDSTDANSDGSPDGNSEASTAGDFNGGEEHPVAAGLGHLRALHEVRWWLSPAQLLERIIADRAVLETAVATGRPRDVWRRLRFVVDQARAWSDAGGVGLRPYLRWARLQAVDTAKVTETVLPETDDDSVRILTIHGAKGLQFPITVVSGMSSRMQPSPRGPSIAFPPGQPAIARLNAQVASEGYDQWQPIDEMMDQHERRRLLYVACTRARDHLVVSLHRTAEGRLSKGTLAAELAQAVTGSTDLSVALEPPARPARQVASPIGAQLLPREQWLAEREEALAVAHRHLVVSATTLADAATGKEDRRTDQHGRRSSEPKDVATGKRDEQPDSDPSLHCDGGDTDEATSRAVVAGEVAHSVLRHNEDTSSTVDATANRVNEGDEVPGGLDPDPGLLKDQPDVQSHPWNRGRYGTAVGRAVHGVLQSLDLATGSGLEALASAQATAEGVPDRTAAVTELARAALTTDVARQAAVTEHWRELFVAAPFGDCLLEGYIDLLYRSPEGLVLADWKTDTVAGDHEIETKLAHYRMQGAAYATALEAVTGEQVARMVFVFLDRDGAVEAELPDLRSAVQEVEAAMSKL